MTQFCRHLSSALAINNLGGDFTVSPCCYFSHNESVHDLSTLPQLREKWNSGDLTKTCSLCMHQEQQKQISYRQAGFDLMTDNDGLQMLTIAVTKQCNLACASCDSNSSSFWQDENVRNGVENTKVLDRKGTNTDDKLVSWFETLDTTNLRYIKFGGGEPLMNNTHLRILELVNNPQDITIQYTSNYTLYPSDKTLAQWQRFKLVKWIGSIDGVGKQFEYLRWPAKFSTVEKLVNKAVEECPGNVMFGIEHTLNPFNVFYYDKIKEWYRDTMLTNRFGDPSDFNIHPCHGTIGIEKTPTALRRKIKEKYGIEHEVSIMLSQYPYTEHESAINWTNTLDKWRNLQWDTTFHEITKYFNSH